MPLVKPRPKQPAKKPPDRTKEWHVQHIKRSQPRWDRHGTYTQWARELADRTGVDLHAILEEWHERAAVRSYLGELPIERAEAAAWDDVLGRFEVRQTEIKL